MRIFAIDPGGTTGWVLLKAPLRIFERGQCREFALADVATIVGQADIVVIERFRLRPAKAKVVAWSDLYTNRLIGSIAADCKRMGKSIVYQEPSCKTFFTDDVLRTAKAYARGEHARDAIRHALYHSWFTCGDTKTPAVQEVLKKLAIHLPPEDGQEQN